MTFNDIYATSIGNYTINNSSEMNKGLSTLLYNMRMSDWSTSQQQNSMSGPNGYHTDDSLLKVNSEYITQFQESMVPHINSYFKKLTNKTIKNATLASWGMIYGNGSYSKHHVHPKADLAIVYYVKVPDNMGRDNGLLEIVDPRPAARWDINHNSIYNITPIEGTGVIFPAWLEHQVTPHYIDGDRISISTNVFIDYEDY